MNTRDELDALLATPSQPTTTLPATPAASSGLPGWQLAAIVVVIILGGAWVSGRFDRGDNDRDNDQPSAIVEQSAEIWRTFSNGVADASLETARALAAGELDDQDDVDAFARERWAKVYDAMIDAMGELDNEHVPQPLTDTDKPAAVEYYRARGTGIAKATR